MANREEIQRIKANNPTISHREAFSTAAKNVRELTDFHETPRFKSLFIYFFQLKILIYLVLDLAVGTLPSYSFRPHVGH